MNENLVFFAMGPDNHWIRKDAGSVNRLFNDLGRGVTEFGRGISDTVAPVRWLFGPSGEKMEQLREVDNQIKGWVRDLDNVLDRAKDAKKQGRMPDFIGWVKEIEKRLRLVAGKTREFRSVHDELFKKYVGRSTEQWNRDDTKIKEAGLFGDQLTEWRMRQLYKKKFQEREMAALNILRAADRVVSKVKGYLGDLASARASGNIPVYIDVLDQIGKSQITFEETFLPLYDTHFKADYEKLVREQEEKAQQRAKEQEAAARQLAKKPVDSEKSEMA